MNKNNDTDNRENSTNINWFPGHMVKAINEIRKDVKLIDIVCLVVDSRIPDSSNNFKMFEFLESKPRLVIFNKYDLADESKVKAKIETYKKAGIYSVVTNANTGQGIDKLIAKICEVGESVKYANKTSSSYKAMKKIYRVVIAGIPNVGKSSVINKMCGRKSAEVGNKPGVTLKKKWVRVWDNIELMDTPGVLWPKLDENDAGIKLALTGNIKQEILDVESLAIHLIRYIREDESYMDMVIKRYSLNDDVFSLEDHEIIYEMGKKRGAYIKGGEVDLERISKLFIDEFKAGKIGRINLE